MVELCFHKEKAMNQITQHTSDQYTAAPGIKQSLRKLPDTTLLLQTDSVVQNERASTLEVLHHLREIEVRRLFVECGYTSMHEMCIKRFKYSEGQTQRRLSSARLLTELPEIQDKIQDGSLNITTLSKMQTFVRSEKQAQHVLSKQDKLELLTELENKSTREAERELLKHSHQPEILMDQFHLRPSSSIKEDAENFMKFEVLLNQQDQKLLQEFKDLFAHELQSMDALSILQLLLKKVMAQKKKKLGLDKENNAPPPSAAEVNEEMTTQKFQTSPKSRFTSLRPYLSVSTKRALWRRAEGCCEHIDPKTTARCSSKHALERDHIKPVALGGDNSLGNLTLHCRAHNSRRAVKTFGVWV